MARALHAHPRRKAPPPRATATCMPDTKCCPRATRLPMRATPTTPPTWRAALMTAEASPPRSGGRRAHDGGRRRRHRQGRAEFGRHEGRRQGDVRAVEAGDQEPEQTGAECARPSPWAPGRDLFGAGRRSHGRVEDDHEVVDTDRHNGTPRADLIARRWCAHRHPKDRGGAPLAIHVPTIPGTAPAAIPNEQPSIRRAAEGGPRRLGVPPTTKWVSPVCPSNTGVVTHVEIRSS